MIKTLVLASRPKTLAAALVPIAVGASLAHAMSYAINWFFLVLALVISSLIQIATNFFNDAIDFEKGSDTHERIGPSRASLAGLIQPELLKRIACGCLIAAFLLSLLFMATFGWPILPLCLLCLYLSYGYTGGPLPLAYKGLGELFVILFFGLLAVGGSFYIHAGEITLEAIIAGIQIGLLSTVLIAINNLRDIQQDNQSGKRTLAVRFGKKFGRWEILCLSWTPYLFGMFWVRQNLGAYYLPLVVLPVSTILCWKIFKTEPSQVFNKFLGLAALQLVMFAAMLSVGFLWMQ